MPDDGPDEAGQRLAPHGRALATVRGFLEASGAERVVVLLDAGAHGELLVEGTPGGPLEVTWGEAAYLVDPEATAGLAVAPLEIPLAPPGSAIAVDAALATVHAPIGVVDSLAEGLLALARALGGRTVATADFASNDPATPLTIAARDGERPVVAVGDGQFEL